MDSNQKEALCIIANKTDINQLKQQRNILLYTQIEFNGSGHFSPHTSGCIDGLVNFIDAFLDAIEVPEQITEGVTL